jgi:hypothetical protein
MKFFGTILLLFFFEFAMGQIPGTPNLLDRRTSPSVYTLGFTILSLQSVEIDAHVINYGHYPVTVSGILSGITGVPTIESYYGKTEDGGTTGGPFKSTAVSLPLTNPDPVYIVAYATTSDGKTHYGKTFIIKNTVASPYTGRVWMLYNLGAINIPMYPPGTADYDAYGYLYQWGRKGDGHEIVYNQTKSPQTPGGFFAPSYDYTGENDNYFFASASTDWLQTPKNDLWQGVNGLNNPCPTGFRVPSSSEFLDETKNFSAQNTTGAINSFLKLPAVGSRGNTGVLGYGTHTTGRYWTSTIASGAGSTSKSLALSITSTTLNTSLAFERANGVAVRCIRGQSSSGGSSRITAFSLGSATGTMQASVPVSAVTQNISATVDQIGDYNIASIVNGVTFSASGTFSETGNHNIELTASGTPLLGTAPGTFINYKLNTSSPSFTFTRTVLGWTTNGTAEVSSYTHKSSTGRLSNGVPVSGITETFTANVVSPGSYNLSTEVINGIKFTASGTFTNTGAQDIVLTASGTPATPGINSFVSNTTPSATFSRTTFEASTNGTGEITVLRGSALFGTMFAGVPIAAGTVYQEITVDVAKAGTYDISTTTENGVTFSGTGTLSTVATYRTFRLYASGTPTYGGSYTFKTNTSSPDITFTNITNAEVSSNGSAIISSPRLGGSTGTLRHPNVASGVSQTIIVNVSKIGTYKISAVANSVTYAASGTFTQTGNDQNIVLNASGTPLTTGSFDYVINTSPNVTFSRLINSQSSGGTAILSSYTPNSSQGTLFVGVVEVGANVEKVNVFFVKGGTFNIVTDTVNGITFSSSGSYGNGGNYVIELTASGTPLASGTSQFTTITNPGITFSRNTDQPEPSSNGTAIITSSNGEPQENLTNGVTSGVLIPTNEFDIWHRYLFQVSKAGTFSIFASANGITLSKSGNLVVGQNQVDLRAQGTPIAAGLHTFTLNISGLSGKISKSSSILVHPSTNGNGHISQYNLSTSSVGEMTRGIPVALTGVTQTVNARVTRIGSYNIATNATNGVTFTGSGTFTQTGDQDIVLTGSGTPTSTATTYTFPIATTPNRSFTRTVGAPSATSNGSAVLSQLTSISSAGTMAAGAPASGVTQTFTANVTTPGTYSINTTANGVTFSGVGKFDNPGIQEIVLTATGTPSAISESNTFTTNTNPIASFTRTTVANPTSNGTINFSSITPNSIGGTLTAGVLLTSSTLQRFNSTNTNTAPGSWNLTTNTVNGVTFSRSGSSLGVGSNIITLLASGTPIESGTFSFTTNNTPSITFTRDIFHPSTNGTAIISSSYTVGTSSGTLRMNQAAGTGVNTPKTIINVNVTTLGTYNLVAITNGLTFTASGTFTTLGDQDIVFNATGMPTVRGTITYNTNTTPIISFTRTVQ